MVAAVRALGVELDSIAGEAHWQLVYVERRNGVFREALAVALNELNPAERRRVERFL